ncbi:MAG: TolC family protein [Chthoniobacteraceae bacterium]
MNVLLTAVLLFLQAASIFAAEKPAVRVPLAKPTEEIGKLNLAAVMRLAGAQNLDIRIATERLAEAWAQHEAARMQFFPYLSPGFAYRRHEGNIQTVDGQIIDADKESLGLGVAVTLQLELGEACYSALTTKKLASAATHAVEVQRQESIWQAVSAYLELVRAKAAVGVASESVHIAEDYAGQVKKAVDVGIAFKGDAFRATAQVERNQITRSESRGRQRIAAARLAQLLHLAPQVELLPVDEPVTLSFGDSHRSLDSLIASAIESRPEMAMSADQLEAAIKGSEAARWAPLVPTLKADYYGGNLGGGTYAQGLRGFNATQEYGIALTWRIGPGGLFDPSRPHLADAKQRGATLEQEKLREEIARQVVEAHTLVHSLEEQLMHVRAVLEAAGKTLLLARERRAFAVGEVLESILAEQDLSRARLDYLTIVTEHNRAQFLLRRAIGADAADSSRARKK